MDVRAQLGIGSDPPRRTETVLRHDPDRGCAADGQDCPFVGIGCYAAGRRFGLNEGDINEPAPDWCPLRRGRVVVEASDG